VIEDVLKLMLQSDVHKKWFIHDLERLILPAIEAGKMKVFHEDDKPMGLYSHAFLSPEAAKGYLLKTRKIQAGDWSTDHESGDLYIMDFIAPYGNARGIARMVQKDLMDRYAGIYRKDGVFMKRSGSDRLNFLSRSTEPREEHEIRA
jgi:hemolysin-activating ACP:hemolysin acyltransferase